MHYLDEHFRGMRFLWWIICFIILIWIFYVPYEIPYRKSKREDSLLTLKKRFAKGEINKEEYEESKKILESDY